MESPKNDVPAPGVLPSVAMKTPSSDSTPQNSSAVSPTSSQGGGAIPSATPPILTKVEDETAVEQQWIQKAKEIIAQTKDDPFMQSKLLAELRTNYLEVRYGKRLEDPKVKP